MMTFLGWCFVMYGASRLVKHFRDNPDRAKQISESFRSMFGK